ncbi:MAG: high-affinity nickel-transporter protein [Haloferacaceae archaeon]
MSLTTLLAGGLLGVRHAVEPDHLAAVATLVDDEAERPGLVGTSWGVGHSLPVVAIGLVLVALGVRVPEPLFGAFELLVGLVLVALGGVTLLDVVGVERHAHDEGGHGHRHLRLGDALVGVSHRHGRGGGFLVGVLHGVAGSGVLVVAMASAAPTVGAAVAFLGAFAVLSTGTMGVVAHLWGVALSAGLAPVLRGAAGAGSVALGALLLAGV